MNVNEIESALDNAINALGLAKLALSKSALPAFSGSDIIRKSDLADSEPRASAVIDAERVLADLNRRVDKLSAARDMDSQVRKTWTIS